MSIQDIQEEIVEEFALFDNKNDAYNYIIELGKKLPDFPEEARTEDNLIKGCQSKVWVIAERRGDQVFYQGDSDSTLVKGLVSLLIRTLSGQSAKDIAATQLQFIDRIGLQGMLSMNRANGLASMVRQMKLYALAYSAVS